MWVWVSMCFCVVVAFVNLCRSFWLAFYVRVLLHFCVYCTSYFFPFAGLCKIISGVFNNFRMRATDFYVRDTLRETQSEPIPFLGLIPKPCGLLNFTEFILLLHTDREIDPDPIPGLELILSLYRSSHWSQSRTGPGIDSEPKPELHLNPYRSCNWSWSHSNLVTCIAGTIQPSGFLVCFVCSSAGPAVLTPIRMT